MYEIAIVIVCSGCGRGTAAVRCATPVSKTDLIGVASTMREAREIAQRIGWRVDDLALCPECQEANDETT